MREALERPGLISLAAGFTDNPSLPVAETRVIIKDLLKGNKGPSRLQYGTTYGDESLRKLTAQRLDRMDGCPKQAKGYDPDGFLITHGSQQLLYILNEILFDPGDIVLVEDPSYFVYLGIMVLAWGALVAMGVTRSEVGNLGIVFLFVVLATFFLVLVLRLDADDRFGKLLQRERILAERLFDNVYLDHYFWRGLDSGDGGEGGGGGGCFVSSIFNVF